MLVKYLTVVFLGLSLQGCSKGDNNATPCAIACGTFSRCLGGQCVCDQGHQNCDGQWNNGCECPGNCATDGTHRCLTTTGSCSPQTPFSCQGVSQYCAATNNCLPCQGNTFNCDGRDHCECGTSGCTSSRCAPQQNCTYTLAKSCATDMKYCSMQNACVACVGTARDCDGQGHNGCECPNGCNGTGGCGDTTSCIYTTPHSCSSNSKYCATNNQCVDCSPTTRRDCNGQYHDGCECESGCNGEQCAQAGACDPTKDNACNSTKQYCSPATSTCVSCGTAYDCDGFASTPCECPNGCDGKKCGTSTGSCDYFSNPDNCNDETKMCSSGSCTGCVGGHFNCDKTRDCECYLGCDGTACKTTKCMYHTCTHDQVCVYRSSVAETIYECVTVPPECRGDRSCSCLKATVCSNCTDYPLENTIDCPQ